MLSTSAFEPSIYFDKWHHHYKLFNDFPCAIAIHCFCSAFFLRLLRNKKPTSKRTWYAIVSLSVWVFFVCPSKSKYKSKYKARHYLWLTLLRRKLIMFRVWLFAFCFFRWHNSAATFSISSNYIDTNTPHAHTITLETNGSREWKKINHRIATALIIS